jgi:hypothetical protein
MAKPEVRLEKRILPLLDITLILVGILILVMGNPDIGEEKVFVAHFEGNQLIYEDTVIFDGRQINMNNARHMMRRAVSGGFSNVEIRDKGNDPALGFKVAEKIEQKLQQIAQTLASEEGLSQTPTVRYIPQNE